jgi:hypothetical protein
VPFQPSSLRLIAFSPRCDTCVEIRIALKRAEAARIWGSGATSALTTGGYRGVCLWLKLKIAQQQLSNQRSYRVVL